MRENLLIISIIFLVYFLYSEYPYYKYGMKYNYKREQLKIPIIPNRWYRTAKYTNEIRYTITEKPKGLNVLFDSLHYKGHIDKFIFLGNEHQEEDVFIIVNEDEVLFYRHFYFFNKEINKCTISDNNGTRPIDCEELSILF